MAEKDRYIGFGKLLDLPSGRVGIELTLNDVTELLEELKTTNKPKVLVLPLKPENVSDWRTHSVKVGESKYRQTLIKQH